MRTNLLPDPSFKSENTLAYTGLAGATLSITDKYSYFGLRGMKVTKSSSNGSGVELALPVPVQSNMPYSFSTYARLPLILPVSEASEIILIIEWMNSLGIIMKTDTSAALTMTDDDTWYRVGGVWMAPPGATFVNMQIIQPLPGSAGASFIVDALMIEQANYLGGYVNNIPDQVKSEIVQRALSPVPQIINGLRLGADITLNGLILNTIDENDTIWVCTGIDGWWGQTAPEMPDIPRGTEAGSYDVEGRPTARSMTVSGFFIPKDPDASLSASIDRLVTALTLVREGGWLMANESPTKAAWVRLSSRPVISTVNPRGRTEFQIILKAGDPNKYHWNDADPDGYSMVDFAASDQFGTATNIGTADVAGVFTFTGPAGAGTKVYNALTEETMILQNPLRGSGPVADVYQVEASNNFVTVYTTESSGLRPGDEISLTAMVVPFSETEDTRIITHISNTTPYNFSYYFESDDVPLTPSGGEVTLVNDDVLVVDTYNRTVTYNGEEVGHRNRLATLTDWIHFGPGENPIEFFDNVTRVEVVSKTIATNEVTLVTDGVHYLIPGEDIVVELPTIKKLATKKLVSNVATLGTEEGHGYSVGDIIDVETVQTIQIATKSRDASNVVTLTTVDDHGITDGDNITVALPAVVTPSTKSLTGNEATITSAIPHGFSPNDTVVVALPASANVTSKNLTGNTVTLTTSSPHGYTTGDNITVALPSGQAVVGKARSGTQIIITTASAHGFAVGDTITITFPTSATLTGARSISGTTNLALVNTTTPHNFSVGDRVTITMAGTPTMALTNRMATTTEVTLTTSGSHGWSAGDKVTVSTGNSRFDGTFYLTGVTSNTITYNSSGSAVAGTSSSGTVTSLTVGYYNGNKIIETIPSTTSFTFREWGQEVTTNATGTSGSIVNATNNSYNGTKTLVSAAGNTFAYNF